MSHRNCTAPHLVLPNRLRCSLRCATQPSRGWRTHKGSASARQSRTISTSRRGFAVRSSRRTSSTVSNTGLACRLGRLLAYDLRTASMSTFRSFEGLREALADADFDRPPAIVANAHVTGLSVARALKARDVPVVAVD